MQEYSPYSLYNIAAQNNKRKLCMEVNIIVMFGVWMKNNLFSKSLSLVIYVLYYTTSETNRKFMNTNSILTGRYAYLCYIFG